MRDFVCQLLDADNGQVLVEFALSALLFFAVLFGTIEFGLVVWRYNMLSNLAQDGARWASVRGSTSSILNASTSDVQMYVQARAVGMAVDVSTPGGEPSTLLPGQTLSVKVQTTIAPLTQLVPHGTLTLSSTASMVIAR
jgi:Flp pilus assembly protein TadG